MFDPCRPIEYLNLCFTEFDNSVFNQFLASHPNFNWNRNLWRTDQYYILLLLLPVCLFMLVSNIAMWFGREKGGAQAAVSQIVMAVVFDRCRVQRVGVSIISRSWNQMVNPKLLHKRTGSRFGRNSMIKSRKTLFLFLFLVWTATMWTFIKLIIFWIITPDTKNEYRLRLTSCMLVTETVARIWVLSK